MTFRGRPRGGPVPMTACTAPVHPRRRRLQRLASLLAGLACAALVALLLTPSPIDPVAWTPAPPPAPVGPLAENARLCEAAHLDLGDARGPEDVAVDPSGRIVTGVEDGRILVRETTGAI